MFTDVKDKLRELAISPIFFVGSGLSIRYIKSPDWIGLLEESVQGIECNFKKIKQKYTHRNPNTNENEIDFEGLAEYLENDYFENMTEEIEEDKTQAYYYRKRIAEIISKYLDDNRENLLSNAEVLELKKTSPAAIITTNYDEMLETIFGDEYTVHIGQNSLLTNVLDGVGEIYKIHGCVTDPDSIVISKKDYNDFFKKSIYLNSKLLTLFLEYPIVFLGYSINDRNVINVLSTIYETLPNNKIKELEKRMWFITRPDDGKDKIIPNRRVNLNNGSYMEINSYELNNFGDFYKAINDISIKRLPIRFLKYLKNNTYQLIASQEYNPKLLNVNIEDIKGIKDFSEGNNFVGLTFSTKEKKVFSSVSEIIKAFIEDDADYDSISVLGVVDEMYNKPIPFYKFLVSLDFNDILSEVIKRFGTDSKIYKRLLNDCEDYKCYLGVEKENIEYSDLMQVDKIEQYLKTYRDSNGFYKNHENVIRRYIILDILKNRIEDLLDNNEVITNYKYEITKAATNLSEEYIRNNRSQIFKLVEKLYNNNNNREFKRLLCLVDRAIYRNELNCLESVNLE
ncbi:SIR2 family protein [Clostridium paraputrificum]|uniref:SIR2 family protein n=1 Tax=Clostridium paraputrificum TaxID=29363 RepID=UPI002FCDD406